VKRFLAEAKGGTADVHPPEKTQPRPHDRHSFEELASQISRMRQSGDAAKIHQTIADILRKAEPTVEEHTGGKDPGADFAVWSDDLRGSLGNPILVELKASKLNEMSFRVAYSRLARKVQDSGSAAGLLLYLEKNGKRFGRPTTWIPSVLWFDAEDFARELSEKSFAQVLVERRNRTVHGLND